MQDPDYFLPVAAALKAGISEVEIHAAINRGELRAVVYRGDVRIPAASFWEFARRLASNTEAPSDSEQS
ncbi:hypothetical protein ACRAWB_01945 [Leifsonia poae]|uniref:hypothetical protein n=1 Tax=Leifsonia poae TaxID=110933 RepID=UPI003D69B6B4